MSRLGRISLVLFIAGLLTLFLVTGQPVAAPPGGDAPAGRGDSPLTSPGDAAHAPFLEKSWSQPTLRENASRAVVLDQAVKALQSRNLPLIGAFVPIGTGRQVIYRSFWGLHAVDLDSGKLAWESESRWSLDTMLREPGKASYVNQWLAAYASFNQTHVILDNSVLGSLSTDGRLVYAIDDLILAPFANPVDGSMMQFGPPIADGVNHNCLEAFDLGTGKLTWEQGDKTGDPEFKSSFFLGAPLLLEGKLYVLNEKEGRLRLLCLDPVKKGQLLWQIDLASFRTRLPQEPSRRRHAAPLAVAKGIMVCPTNAGSLVGVDLESRTLLWAYSYRDGDPKPPAPQDPNQPQLGMPRFPISPANQVNWKVTPPRIADGRVVYTAPDGQSIECLNLLDGSLEWKVRAGQDDVFLADVFQDKALIVGRRSVRAMNLDDGKVAWTVETGVPSGLGVRAGSVYYLPLAASASSKEPEVIAIDVARGQAIAHSPSRKKEVPGNLFLHEGSVLSQTTGEVVAYPQLRAKLAQIDRLLAGNPKDAVGLTDRGELKLAKGDLQGSVDDLHEALAANALSQELRERARRILYEAMLEYLQRDFNAAEKYLGECEKLSTVVIPENTLEADRERLSAEEKRRKADFLFVKARGRERQGQRLEALQAFLDFLALGRTEEVVTSPDDGALKAPRDVLVGGRITALLANAGAKERVSLEAKVLEGWKKIQDAKDVKAAERFVRVFGAGSATGREARLWLGRTLAEERTLAQAELYLLQVVQQRDSEIQVARALDGLGALYLQQNLMDDAASCFVRLKEEFGAVAVRDGKTGAEIYQDLAADKRLIPFLDRPSPTMSAKIKVTEQHGAGTPSAYTPFTFEGPGDALPYFRRYRPTLEMNQHQFRLLDRSGNQAAWSVNLTRTNFQNIVYGGNPQGGGRFPNIVYGGDVGASRHAFQTVGHVIVLNLAHMVYALDPITRKVLWERSLTGTTAGTAVNIMQNNRDGGITLTYPDGFVLRAGQMGPVAPSSVCLLTREGLMALDPLSGTVLWSRADVPATGQVFGDGEYVFLIEQGADGAATATRVFQASDGSTVKAPDFSAAFGKRLARSGRRLLLSEDKKPGSVLRAYDVLTGKDVWTRELPAGAVVLRSLAPELTGTVDPQGKVTVVDVATGKETMSAQMDPKHLGEGAQVYLWRDAAQVYLAAKETEIPGGVQVGQAAPAFVPGSGLRQLPVNGMVYAFDPKTGDLRWRTEAFHQTLLLDPLQDLPVLWFAGRNTSWAGGGGNRVVTQGISMRVIDKRTGKFLYDHQEANQNLQLLTLATNPDTGTSELLGVGLKVTAAVER